MQLQKYVYGILVGSYDFLGIYRGSLCILY